VKVDYVTRDNFGIRAGISLGLGPGLLGATARLGSDDYNEGCKALGDIKDFMIELATDKDHQEYSFGPQRKSSAMLSCLPAGSGPCPDR
jgi:hypothetical protein